MGLLDLVRPELDKLLLLLLVAHIGKSAVVTARGVEVRRSTEKGRRVHLRVGSRERRLLLEGNLGREELLRHGSS